MGMGGVQRVYNIPKNLKKLGWDIDVYTPLTPYSYPKDNISFQLKELNVKRSFCPDPMHLLPGKVATPGAGKRDFLSFPDNKIFWLPFLLKDIKSTDLIIVSCPPFSLILTLLLIKDTPCVIDYRDKWTESYLGKYLFKAEESLAKKIEKKCIDKASAVVTVTKKIRDYLQKKYPENKNKIHLIRNGFEEGIFPKTIKKRKTDKFVITYMGSFNDTFNPDIIFDGLENLFSLKPKLRKRISFKYIGPSILEHLRKRAQKIGLVDFITTGYLPHKDALSELIKSDLLILIGGSGIEDKWLVPGKLYQYLRTGLPILSITENKEIKNLIGTSGMICNSNPENFASSVLKVIENYDSFKPISDYYSYSWKNLGKEYSNLMKNVLY
jgi:glycosyltransferase involved in cell wall biosynthesis